MATSMDLKTPCCNTQFITVTSSGKFGEETVDGYECIRGLCFNEWNIDGELIYTAKEAMIEGEDFKVFGHPDSLDEKLEHARYLTSKHGYQTALLMMRNY